MPIQDPNDSKKQVFKGISYSHQSFIPVFDTAAELTGKKGVKGAMGFALDDSKIYVHNGTAWVKTSALS
tara:strand:- start:156 stop:362 length:207 start_codon:yes stop_codon:yes gene_type:complete